MEKKFISIRQAAEYSSLSARKIYKDCQDRKIKYFKVGKRIVIDIKDFEDFIRQNVQEPVDWDEKARELNK